MLFQHLNSVQNIHVISSVKLNLQIFFDKCGDYYTRFVHGIVKKKITLCKIQNGRKCNMAKIYIKCNARSLIQVFQHYLIFYFPSYISKVTCDLLEALEFVMGRYETNLVESVQNVVAPVSVQHNFQVVTLLSNVTAEQEIQFSQILFVQKS